MTIWAWTRRQTGLAVDLAQGDSQRWDRSFIQPSRREKYAYQGASGVGGEEGHRACDVATAD
jgi:hypothetical protein